MAAPLEEDSMGVMGRATTVGAAVRATRGRHPLGQRIGALLPMMRDAFTGRWVDAPRFKLLAGLAGVAYVLSPLDLMPEVFLGPFGLGDDLAIAAVAVAALLGSAEDWLDHRDATRSDVPPTAARGEGPIVVEGVVLDRR
jgi:uncharacterized membrane protein YkvA (DUF1232 family)